MSALNDYESSIEDRKAAGIAYLKAHDIHYKMTLCGSKDYAVIRLTDGKYIRYCPVAQTFIYGVKTFRKPRLAKFLAGRGLEVKR